MTDAFVLGGVRTPFARYGSSGSHIRIRPCRLVCYGLPVLA